MSYTDPNVTIPWDAFRINELRDWNWCQPMFNNRRWRRDARFFYRRLRERYGMDRQAARDVLTDAVIYLTAV